MWFLVLAILCSASIALIFRHSESTGTNRYAVTSANYLTAVLVGGVLLAMRGMPSLAGAPLSSRLDEVARVLGTGDRLSPAASPVWAICVGLVAGVFFFLAFLYYQIAVRDRGVGLAGSFAKLGILLPATLALVVWKDIPSVGQLVGTGLAVLSILLVHGGRVRGGGAMTALLLLFAFGGLSEFSNSVFQRHGLQPDKDLFLVTTFGVALLLSLIAIVVARRPVAWRDVTIGIAVGVPNYFSSRCLILALEDLDPVVVFPVYGAGTILILAAAGSLVFGEKLSRAEKIAIAATAAAMVLIQL
jgi:drug/metabolite transporter (DMT)-like permease